MTLPTDITITERVSRWLAARTTRRSFIGNVGRIGLVATGGALVSQVLSERAEARVCGQSGVSPKCPTYDCFAPSVWGWCWYAGNSSCCADGGLKKICDCCRANHSNVHGYCPEGSNVYCVVESCLEDPRVLKVAVVSHTTQSAAGLAVSRTAAVAGGSVPAVVIAHPSDRLVAALATPVAARLGGVVLTTPLDGIPAEVTAEISRLGAKQVIVVGAGFGAGVVAGFGLIPGVAAVGHLGTNPDVALASIEVARWLVTDGAQPHATVIGAGAEATALAPAAAGFAALRRGVLLVGPDAAGAFRAEVPAMTMTFVGEVAPAAGPADGRITGTDAFDVSRHLGEASMAAEPAAQFPLAIAIAEDTALSSSLVQPGTVTLIHPPDLIDASLRDWLIRERARFTAVHVAAGGRAGLAEARVYVVQSAMNGFSAHLLVGSDGMGLPVIPQPNEEKPMGRARATGPPPTAAKPMSKRTTVKLSAKPTATTRPPASSVPATVLPAAPESPTSPQPTSPTTLSSTLPPTNSVP